MAQEIVVEGSAQEIARRISEFPGRIVKAILVVEGNVPPGEGEDAWTRDLRRWAASHKPAKVQVDYSRDAIYGDGPA